MQTILGKYNADIQHASQVQKLSLIIFDEMQKLNLHNMTQKDRKYLEIASILHDIGYFLGQKGHNKHSFELIQKEDFSCIDEMDKKFIGAIARYHRGALPSKEHEFYNSLNKKDKALLCALAGILRLADALDRAHLAVVFDMKFFYDEPNNILACHLVPRLQDFHFDLKSYIKKKDLFEKAFKVQLLLLNKNAIEINFQM